MSLQKLPDYGEENTVYICVGYKKQVIFMILGCRRPRYKCLHSPGMIHKFVGGYRRFGTKKHLP
jgi:hypothetical protein